MNISNNSSNNLNNNNNTHIATNTLFDRYKDYKVKELPSIFKTSSSGEAIRLLQSLSSI